MRSCLKEWKNGRYLPLCTCRIKWYQGESDNDIRLSMEDSERRHNVYPKSQEEAQELWEKFKQNAPPKGVQKAFVAEILKGTSHDPK